MTALREAPEAGVPDRNPTRCAAGGQPHHVTNGQGKPISGLLCDHHLDTLTRMLRDIEREAALYQITDSGKPLPNLDPLPSMQIRWDRSGGSLASQQAPARLDVLVHTDTRHGTGKSEDDEDLHAAGLTASVLVVLHSWAEQVRREHHLTRPTTTVRLGWVRSPRGPVCPRPCEHDTCGRWITDTIPAAPTITGERNLLTRQLPWIARQDWVGDMYRDVRQLRDQLRRANGTAPDDPLPGRCPTMINGQECGGPLWPVKPKHTSGPAWTGSSASSVRCSACRRRWEGPLEMARLALSIETQSRAS